MAAEDMLAEDTTIMQSCDSRETKKAINVLKVKKCFLCKFG
jgi:hypothetical protein